MKIMLMSLSGNRKKFIRDAAKKIVFVGNFVVLKVFYQSKR